MNEEKIIISLRKDLKYYIDKDYKERFPSFFKEDIKLFGVRACSLKELEKRYFKELKNIPKKDFLKIIEILLQQKEYEFKYIAFNLLYKRKHDFLKEDFSIFERFLKKYVKNWAHCDSFITHSFGYLVYKYPELLNRTNSWINSDNRWLKRSASTILIYTFKYHKNNKEFYSALNRLKTIVIKQINDTDDLVQKAYGWSAKEASNIKEEAVFKFIYKYKNKLPRTALRYAIENMSIEKKKIAMFK